MSVAVGLWVTRALALGQAGRGATRGICPGAVLCGKPVLWAQLLAPAGVAPVQRQIHGGGFGLGILLCSEGRGITTRLLGSGLTVCRIEKQVLGPSLSPVGRSRLQSLPRLVLVVLPPAGWL